MEVNENVVTFEQAHFPADKTANVFHRTPVKIRIFQYTNLSNTTKPFIQKKQPNKSVYTLFIEKAGNVRINIQSSKPNEENIIVSVIALTAGLFEVNGSGRIKPSNLM